MPHSLEYCDQRDIIDLLSTVPIPMKSPRRTEMIAPLDSDMMSPPGTGAALAVGLLALSWCCRQSSFRFS
jgi:hypothetical protein